MGEHRELVERFYDAFNRGDFDAAMTCFHDDVRTVEPSTGEMDGVDAWRAHGEAFKTAMPDARLELRRAFETPDTIVVEGAFTGTFTGPLATPQGEAPPTGNHLDLPYADVLTLRDGRIAEHHVYYDQMTMLGQLGLIPEGETAGA